MKNHRFFLFTFATKIMTKLPKLKFNNKKKKDTFVMKYNIVRFSLNSIRKIVLYVMYSGYVLNIISTKTKYCISHPGSR